jgi:hypothetical protein
VKYLALACFFSFICVAVSDAATQSAPKPKLRPSTGIGILQIDISAADSAEPLYLYDEPALSRRGTLNLGTVPPFEYIFGSGSTVLPVVVTARKGTWLRVAYDDAGRESWLNPSRKNVYLPWDSFFKMHICRVLPGLQKKYYQLYQAPGRPALAVMLTTHAFKVLRLDNDWAHILLEQTTLGWVRWRDEDGRLLIGISTPLSGIAP